MVYESGKYNFQNYRKRNSMRNQAEKSEHNSDFKFYSRNLVSRLYIYSEQLCIAHKAYYALPLV